MHIEQRIGGQPTDKSCMIYNVMCLRADDKGYISLAEAIAISTDLAEDGNFSTCILNDAVVDLYTHGWISPVSGGGWKI